MAWGAVAGAAISVVGGMMASKSQGDAAQGAADTSAGAAKYSADIQKQMYDQTRQDQAPWRAAGGGALNKLADLLGIEMPVNSNPETRQQIYDRLKSQYSTNGAGSGSGTSSVQDLVRNAYTDGMGQFTPNLEGSPDLTRVLAGVEAQASSGGQPVDDAALNAAVDAELAKQGAMQPKSGQFGSLLRDFSMADYQADPGYAFRQSEGEKALERSAAARGGLYSGRAMKDMARFSQGLASEEYQNAFNRFQSNQNNRFNRLASMAGVGQTANNALSAAGSNYANSVGNLAMTNAANQGNAALVGGNARASAYQGVGNALGGINLNGLFGGGGSKFYNPANEGVGGLSASYIQGGF